MLGRELVDGAAAAVAAVVDATVVAAAAVAGVVVPYHWVANTKPLYCYYPEGLAQPKRNDPMIDVVAAFAAGVVADDDVQIDTEPQCIHTPVVVAAAVDVAVVHWRSYKSFAAVATGHYYYYYYYYSWTCCSPHVVVASDDWTDAASVVVAAAVVERYCSKLVAYSGAMNAVGVLVAEYILVPVSSFAAAAAARRQHHPLKIHWHWNDTYCYY